MFNFSHKCSCQCVCQSAVVALENELEDVKKKLSVSDRVLEDLQGRHEFCETDKLYWTQALQQAREDQANTIRAYETIITSMRGSNAKA